MRVNKSVEQAIYVVVMLELEAGGRPLKSSVMSRLLGVSDSYLKKVLRKMVVAGIVESSASRGGGPPSAARPRRVTLADIVDAVDDGVVPGTGHLAQNLFGDDPHVGQAERKVQNAFTGGFDALRAPRPDDRGGPPRPKPRPGRRHRLGGTSRREAPMKRVVVVTRTIAAPHKAVFDWFLKSENYVKSPSYSARTGTTARHSGMRGSVRTVVMVAGRYHEKITEVGQDDFVRYIVIDSFPRSNNRLPRSASRTRTTGTLVTWTIDIDAGMGTAFAGFMAKRLYGTIMDAAKRSFGRG